MHARVNLASRPLIRNDPDARSASGVQRRKRREYVPRGDGARRDARDGRLSLTELLERTNNLRGSTEACPVDVSGVFNGLLNVAALACVRPERNFVLSAELVHESKGILSYAGGYKWLTCLACFLSGISALLALLPFIFIWKIVEETLRVLPDVTEARGLADYGVGALVATLCSMLIYFVALMCSHVAAFRVARNMRSQAMRHLVELPIGFFASGRHTSGRLRRVIDESAAQTESYLAHMLPDLAGAYVTPVGVIILLFTFDWRLGIVSLIPFAIGAFFLSRMLGSSMASAMSEYQSALEDINHQAVEYVRGIPVVKTFQQSVFSFRRFHDAILNYKKWAVNYTLSMRLPLCGYTVAINACFAFLIPAGIFLLATAVDRDRFLLDFIFYLIFTPFCTVMMNKIMWSSEYSMQARDAQRRIEAILDEPVLARASSPLVPTANDVTFEGVHFSYPGAAAPALDGVSFRVEEGETVALVGPSGGGKTTAASLIPRFWDASRGRVRIGGVDVREIDDRELMRRVSFVFQQSHLFKASLLENIRLARPDATREEVMAAAEAARCADVVRKLPAGLDTVVGARGVYLSGGEMQRVALARAILKDAPIVVLDEATAFADPENEFQIQKAFETLTRGKTVLMIAHRLSAVRNADRVLVLERGRVAEEGRHADLVTAGGAYARMWREYETSARWKVGGLREVLA